jgi:hypothetical protein
MTYEKVVAKAGDSELICISGLSAFILGVNGTLIAPRKK